MCSTDSGRVRSWSTRPSRSCAMSGCRVKADGPPSPGVVVGWQHAPVRNATEAGWHALAATCPFGTALLVEWMRAERLLGVRDARASTDGSR